MFALLIALAFVAPLDKPATQSSAQPQEVPSTVLVLQSKADAGFDEQVCIDATEAHAGGSGLKFERLSAGSDAALSEALSQSRSKPLLAVFWFEARSDVVAIYLYAPQTHAVYLREIERTSDAAVVEAVGLITASTAMALQSGETLAMRKVSEEEWAALQAEPEPVTEAEAPVEQPPEVKAEPEVPDELPPSAPVPLEVGVGYRGASFNTRAPWQHGIAGRFAMVLGRGVLVELAYSWMAPANIASDRRLDLARHEPEVAAGWRWDLGTRVQLDALGIAAAELNRWQASQRGATRVRARLGGAVRPAVEVGQGVFVEARLGARVGLNRFDFVVCESPDVVCTGDARNVVASGWRVAPEASIGISYRFGAARKK